MADQGYLCAYCQRRIPTAALRGWEGMHIEHWLPRSNYSQAEFQWTNLLAVCPGDPALETGSKGARHCDAKRGNDPLYLHPVEGMGPNPTEHLAYTSRGEIIPLRGCANPIRVEEDIGSLGLNAERLKINRRELYDVIKEKTDFSARSLRSLYSLFAARQQEESKEYCEVARYFLRRWARSKGIQLTG